MNSLPSLSYVAYFDRHMETVYQLILCGSTSPHLQTGRKEEKQAAWNIFNILIQQKGGKQMYNVHIFL